MDGGRKVLDESCFREETVFNDDRVDFKTKNDKYVAEALLQQLFWVEGASRTSPNQGGVEALTSMFFLTPQKRAAPAA